MLTLVKELNVKSEGYESPRGSKHMVLHTENHSELHKNLTKKIGIMQLLQESAYPDGIYSI